MKSVFKSSILWSTILLFSNNFSAQRSINRHENHSQQKEVKMPVIQTFQENKEIVRKLYELCLNKRKLELLKEFVSEDYTGPQGEKGVSGFEETIKTLLQGFPDIQWTIEDLLQDGDRVAIKWIWHGTHKGTFRGFPASQKPFTNQAIAIYLFKDNKIVYAWLQSDRLGFFQQMGIVPQNVGVPPQPQKKSN